MPSIPRKDVSPRLARAAERAKESTEQAARIERLKRMTAAARHRGRDRVTIKLHDLETIIAVMAIPGDLERARA
jgi:hypothetical protein